VSSDIRPDLSLQPRGFLAGARNAGIRDASLDLGVVFSPRPAAAAAVFTRNAFCGHPVTVGREHVRGGRIAAVVVNSKNANVATGPQGLEDTREICRLAGSELGVPPEQVLPCSTGVIGRPLPMDRLRAGLRGIRADLRPDGLESFARVGDAVLAACCKGSGMIAPQMATMLAFFFTDALLEPSALDRALRAAVDVSFHMVSVDGDTSTSDTVAALANGEAGPVDPGAFAAVLSAVAVELAQEVARDGEGATKLIEAVVSGAPDVAAARRAAKSIVASPLVKAAVWGGDPNWGRVAMAVGKCFDLALDPARLRIAFGDTTVYAGADLGPSVLPAVAGHLRGERVRIAVDLGLGGAAATAWGCDLTPEYVRINGEYTT
jgi:glutamate N-acetyltransferase/amino-acid N-acetyltransferase